MNCRLTGDCDVRNFIPYLCLERFDAYCLEFCSGIVLCNCENTLSAQSCDAGGIDFEVGSPYKLTVFCKNGNDGYCNKRDRFKSWTASQG
jgi:hypothetical protein